MAGAGRTSTGWSWGDDTPLLVGLGAEGQFQGSAGGEETVRELEMVPGLAVEGGGLDVNVPGVRFLTRMMNCPPGGNPDANGW